MAVKAVAIVQDLATQDGSASVLRAGVKYTALDGTYALTNTIEVQNLDPGAIDSAIRDAVRTDAEANSDIEFGILDSVRLIGGIV